MDSEEDSHYQPSDCDGFNSDDSRHGQAQEGITDRVEVMNMPTEESPDEEMPVEAAKKRTRKRQKHESKREAQKKKRNSEKAYTTKKGKQVPSKRFSNEPCRCKKNCNNLLDEESRKHAFSVFWHIGSFKMQNAYLCGLVKQETPKTRRRRDGTRQGKSSSNTFFVHNLQGNSVKVCRKYFLDTFQLSHGRLTRALKKLKQGKPPGTDERGICHIPVNKVSDDRMNVVREHISSFPAYQSHYTRSQNPNRKYLPSDMTIIGMYKSYLEYCTGKSEPVSEAVYRRTFNSEFNLYFHSPLKDTCSKCDSYKTKVSVIENEEEKRHMAAMHELHLRKVEAARTGLKEDTTRSKTDPTVFTFTFDLEKALPFPKLTTGIAYYKRNMYLYNLGVHEQGTDLGYMYTWNETIASRGSQEISSCVTKHILTRAKNYKHIIMYSDSCTGQNRNWNFALSMQKLTQLDTAIDTIDLKYMVSGHSYLPNDTDFASIESYLKKCPLIFSPDEINDAIMKCRAKNQFHVTKMQREDFKSAKELTDAVTKRSVNDTGGKFSWLTTQWIRFIRSEPYKLFYEESIQEDIPFESISLILSKQKKKKTQHGVQVPIGTVVQKILYSAPRPVTKEKKRDMLDLLDFIPPVFHGFYHGLVTSATIEDIGFLEDVLEENADNV